MYSFHQKGMFVPFARFLSITSQGCLRIINRFRAQDFLERILKESSTFLTDHHQQFREQPRNVSPTGALIGNPSTQPCRLFEQSGICLLDETSIENICLRDARVASFPHGFENARGRPSKGKITPSREPRGRGGSCFSPRAKQRERMRRGQELLAVTEISTH